MLPRLRRETTPASWTKSNNPSPKGLSSYLPTSQTQPQPFLPFVFCYCEVGIPFTLLRILLQRGGISLNPGPIYICPICGVRVDKGSVYCNGCDSWCHMRKCTNITRSSNWSPAFRCENCLTSPQLLKNSTVLKQNKNMLDRVNILQFNINGLGGKVIEIEDFLTRKNIHIAALQETKLSPKSRTPAFKHYALLRRDRETDGGGGVAFLIHHTVPFHTVTIPNLSDPHLEFTAIRIKLANREISIANIYIPPVSSCNKGYKPNLSNLFNGNYDLILGDFNAHSTMWNSDIDTDNRGKTLCEEINLSTYTPLNDERQTRLPTNGLPSSPDISLVINNLIPYTTWDPLIELSSDHLPIIISISFSVGKAISQNQTFTNYKKANWKEFEDSLEKYFADLADPKCPIEGERLFSTALKKAASIHIPSGRIKQIIPGIPTPAAKLIMTRDLLRESDPTDNRIGPLNANISKLINDHRKAKWEEHLNSCSHSTNANVHWRTIKSLTNPQTTNPNEAITFNGKSLISNREICNKFNRQFTPKLTKLADKSKRKIDRLIKRSSSIDQTYFKHATVCEAIKSTKNSKAKGPDGICPSHIKHLGFNASNYLTKIINLSLQTFIIPPNWKKAIIIPLLKPGKNTHDSLSYRPISILSPVAKVLESLLLPTITTHLPASDYQHGFKKGHSTSTALVNLCSDITTGFNQKPPKRTIVVALDLSKAFDMVSHDTLLEEMSNSSLPRPTLRWLSSYLRGRMTQVSYRNEKSKFRPFKQGVPQGSVLSPALFNFYTSKIPITDSNVGVIQYADDTTTYASNVDWKVAALHLNTYLDSLYDFLEARNLQINATKSSATFFSTCTNELNLEPPIIIKGHAITYCKKPKILGVTFDGQLSFVQHTENITDKMNKRNNILKCLTGTGWGKSKETMLITYKAIGRSLCNYAAPVWTPRISDSNWAKLQRAQNQALRIATGCHRMTPIDHLHNETKIVPVQPHCELLAKQFLTLCYLPSHPSNRLLLAPLPPRSLRVSLNSKFSKAVKRILEPFQQINLPTLKSVNETLHRHTVEEVLKSYKINIVLGGYPPPIADEEWLLPRATRSTLAQLRSGYSIFLSNYRARIGLQESAICFDCNREEHSTNHLFICRPTYLTTMDLWLQPIACANFLGLAMREVEEE